MDAANAFWKSCDVVLYRFNHVRGILITPQLQEIIDLRLTSWQAASCVSVTGCLNDISRLQLKMRESALAKLVYARITLWISGHWWARMPRRQPRMQRGQRERTSQRIDYYAMAIILRTWTSMRHDGKGRTKH